MKAAVTFVARVTDREFLEVASPPFERFKEKWDGSLPKDKHEIFGHNFPRLEKYISTEVKNYFDRKAE